jgi:hypothetical protein
LFPILVDKRESIFTDEILSLTDVDLQSQLLNNDIESTEQSTIYDEELKPEEMIEPDRAIFMIHHGTIDERLSVNLTVICASDFV